MGLCASPSWPTRAETTNAVPPVRLDPVIVTGKTVSLHEVASESDLVGPANQPEWTTRRVFAETDIYVIPTGEIEFNQFYVSSHPREGKPENLFESEFEFGLPWRTQFDVEMNYSVNSGRGRYDETLLELPHALADWGKIPFNPTIDGGWRFISGEADAYFFRLLLAEEFCKRFHFGADLTFDQQVGGERERSYELNTALSYAAIDSKLNVGVELLAEYESDAKDEHSTSVLLGPTVLYKPTRNTHVGLMPLFGLNHDAPILEAFIVFGIDFELFAHRGSANGEADSGSNPFQMFRKCR